MPPVASEATAHRFQARAAEPAAAGAECRWRASTSPFDSLLDDGTQAAGRRSPPQSPAPPADKSRGAPKGRRNGQPPGQRHADAPKAATTIVPTATAATEIDVPRPARSPCDGKAKADGKMPELTPRPAMTPSLTTARPPTAPSRPTSSGRNPEQRRCPDGASPRCRSSSPPIRPFRRLHVEQAAAAALPTGACRPPAIVAAATPKANAAVAESRRGQVQTAADAPKPIRCAGNDRKRRQAAAALPVTPTKPPPTRAR